MAIRTVQNHSGTNFMTALKDGHELRSQIYTDQQLARGHPVRVPQKLPVSELSVDFE